MGPNAQLLLELLVRARAEHPLVDYPDQAFFDRVGWASESHPLDDLDASALYLTGAAGAGNEQAVARIEADWFADARSGVGRLALGAAQSDDALQSFRDKLFVGSEGRPPRILSYAGRGSLRGWLRVGAVREALRLSQVDSKMVIDDELVLAPSDTDPRDPELAQMRAMYQPVFRRCFQAALSALPVRDKNLLRQQTMDGLTIDDLAKLYRVHRATCARWLEMARQSLFEDTRRRLIEDVGISDDECDSIIRLVQSQLHVTLKRAFDT